MLLTAIQNKYITAAAVFITVVAGSLTIYHLVNYQMPLTKLTLEKATREAESQIAQ